MSSSRFFDMSARWDEPLAKALEQRQRLGLLRQLMPVESEDSRTLVVEGRSLVNFGSNDYLGLARHPAVCEAAMGAIRDWGAGSTASRLICGSLAPHHELEQALAEFKGTEAALTFATGHATALGTIPALVEQGDFVLLDRLSHACLVDAARASGAMIRVFRHNDLEDLHHLLVWADRERSKAARSPRPPRILVITESVFSMDGDRAPLRDLVELKDRYGAWLMVDEAHATGLFGTRGEGCIGEADLTERVEVQMGTLGKALGSAGGFIAGTRRLVDWLVQQARTFMFSTAPPPAQAAAARAAIELVRGPEGDQLRSRLWENVRQAAAALARAGPAHAPGSPQPQSAILPWILGDNQRALDCAAAAREAGLFIPAVRYPAVGRKSARLRITISAAHQPADIEKLRAFAESARQRFNLAREGSDG
jgi:8-amino-7-oxononanoate synthase